MFSHAKTTQTTGSQTDTCLFRANARKIYTRIKKQTGGIMFTFTRDIPYIAHLRV